ncbi:hypothetical protein CEF01_11430 [Lactobacillus crispatus]|nr:hypothetical protein CEF01_11430 [Lactobacillus crispatus]TDM75444.1 hypothetical protein CEE97_11240 [Lactobacillus crispatus]TDM96779.1 hypothetical protein CEE87_13090 [Lactobacillus crispatus]
MFKEINLRNHSSLHKLFYSLRYVSIYIGVFIFMFGLQLYRLNSFSLSGYTIKDALIHNRYYAYMLLTFPMTEVLATAKRRMKFINNIRVVLVKSF